MTNQIYPQTTFAGRFLTRFTGIAFMWFGMVHLFASRILRKDVEFEDVRFGLAALSILSILFAVIFLTPKLYVPLLRRQRSPKLEMISIAFKAVCLSILILAADRYEGFYGDTLAQMSLIYTPIFCAIFVWMLLIPGHYADVLAGLRDVRRPAKVRLGKSSKGPPKPPPIWSILLMSVPCILIGASFFGLSEARFIPTQALFEIENDLRIYLALISALSVLPFVVLADVRNFNRYGGIGRLIHASAFFLFPLLFGGFVYASGYGFLARGAGGLHASIMGGESGTKVVIVEEVRSSSDRSDCGDGLIVVVRGKFERRVPVCSVYISGFTPDIGQKLMLRGIQTEFGFQYIAGEKLK